MVGVNGGAVIDQKGSPLPDQDVGIPVGAIRIGGIGIEPHQVRRETRVNDLPGGKRIEVECAVEVARADVDPVAPAQDLLDLGIGLGPAERRTDLDQRGLRHRESEPLGEHSHDQLGDEGLGSLAGAAELDHEETRIRGDDGRQRSAFPKRLQVPGCLMNRERHEPS